MVCTGPHTPSKCFLEDDAALALDKHEKIFVFSQPGQRLIYVPAMDLPKFDWFEFCVLETSEDLNLVTVQLKNEPKSYHSKLLERNDINIPLQELWADCFRVASFVVGTCSQHF